MSKRKDNESMTQSVDQSQIDKFIDKAKELGVDEDESAFEEKLKRITGKTPEKKAPDK
ncbi:MAG: hypothetical protein P1V34_06280 [Alphaproteobacteria bacterium]|nr:hypothetical protein [Alphaproteobacteria bacterium]